MLSWPSAMSRQAAGFAKAYLRHIPHKHSLLARLIISVALCRTAPWGAVRGSSWRSTGTCITACSLVCRSSTTLVTLARSVRASSKCWSSCRGMSALVAVASSPRGQGSCSCRGSCLSRCCSRCSSSRWLGWCLWAPRLLGGARGWSVSFVACFQQFSISHGT